METRPTPADLRRHRACIAVDRLFPELGRQAQIRIAAGFLAADAETVGPARMAQIQAEVDRLAAESAEVDAKAMSATP